jgi:subtilase family serine protease
LFGSAPYTPAQISAAYGFNQTKLPNGQVATGAGQTIAIVDAYYDPTILSDVNAFSNRFGLPQLGTSSGPQFTQIRQNNVSQTSPGAWSTETALDVEWAHAVAPQANIVLVEAQDNSLNNLLNAVTTAATTPGVNVVSMSWGTGEFTGETAYDKTFQVPNVSFVASSGDSGSRFGVNYPAASPNVLSVGGTSLLTLSNNSYFREIPWAGSTGGLSAIEPEPSYQQGVQSSGVRTGPDVAYNANPNTGYQVLDSSGGGWLTVGGTSAGAPQWAGIIALADQYRSAEKLGPLGNAVADVYSLPQSDFHSTGVGSNGTHTAGTDYNLATGLGSPIVNLIVPSLGGASSKPAVVSNATTAPVAISAAKAQRHDIASSGTGATNITGDPSSQGQPAAIQPAVSATQAQVTGLIDNGLLAAGVMGLQANSTQAGVDSFFTTGAASTGASGLGLNSLGMPYFNNSGSSWANTAMGSHVLLADDALMMEASSSLLGAPVDGVAPGDGDYDNLPVVPEQLADDSAALDA